MVDAYAGGLITDRNPQDINAVDWSNPVAQHPLNEGLISWWLATPGFNGYGSVIWKDLLRRNDGTLTTMDPAVDWEIRENGWGALDFDGSSDYVNMGDVLDFERTDSLTILMWINPTSSASNSHLIAKMGSAEPFRGWDVRLLTANTVDFILRHDNGDTDFFQVVTDAAAAPDGEWTLIGVTYNGSSDAAGVKIYSNGSSVSVSTGHDGLTDTTLSSSPLHIAARNNTQHFNGLIDDVRVWNRALSPGEVYELYQQGRNYNQNLLRRRPVRFAIPETPVVSGFPPKLLDGKLVDGYLVGGGLAR